MHIHSQTRYFSSVQVLVQSICFMPCIWPAARSMDLPFEMLLKHTPPSSYLLFLIPWTHCFTPFFMEPSLILTPLLQSSPLYYIKCALFYLVSQMLFNLLLSSTPNLMFLLLFQHTHKFPISQSRELEHMLRNQSYLLNNVDCCFQTFCSQPGNLHLSGLLRGDSYVS